MASPLIIAASEFAGAPVDVYIRPTPANLQCKGLFRHKKYVKNIRQYPEKYFEPIYDRYLITSNYHPLNQYGNSGEVVRPREWKKGEREIDYNMELIQRIGFQGRTPAPFVCKSPRKFMFPKNTVGFHIGCKPAWAHLKAWPYYKELSDLLLKEGITVVVVGSDADLPLFKSKTWSSYVKRYFSLSLTDTAALISQVALFITNDSGLMHLAAALNVPTIAIFGATNPAKYKPRNVSLIQREPILSCQPCIDIMPVGYKCPRKTQCLKDISHERVFDVAMKYLKIHS
ncbi:MAG: glycosyltransferase family 9 protein [bacterium]